MNKNTKIWLNYIAGGCISLFLLWNIYGQIQHQLAGIDSNTWKYTGDNTNLYICIMLMLVNTSLESFKWYLLANAAEPMRYGRALASYLAGIAFSIITPNRVGEYPGRILYLGRGSTFRYINVSVLGMVSQLWTVYIFGLAGLIYYNMAYPNALTATGLAACVIVNVLIAFVYWRFEGWVPLMARYAWLRRFSVYGRLLGRVATGRQMKVLAVSLLRFTIFTAQYLFLLKWMNVDMQILPGFCMAALFFWVMAVIPSITLTELGVRGTVSVYLFQHLSTNTVGIVAATTGLWLLNLILPSVAGSILIMRMKILR